MLQTRFHQGARFSGSLGRAGSGVHPLLVLLVVSLAAVLAGCGSSGGGSSNTPGASTGTISGTVDSRQLSAAPAAQGGSASTPPTMQSLTVAVDGTTITAPVQSNGSFTLPPIPPGSYIVSVRTSDGSVAGHASVQVSEGMDTPTVLTLLPAGQVAGIVSERDSTGAVKPVSGVDVALSAATEDVRPIPVFKPGAPPVAPPVPGPVPTPAPVPPGQPIPLSGGAAGSGIAAAGIAAAAVTTTTTTQNGSSAAGAPPVPTPSDSTPLVLHSTTAADGSYAFAGVPAGLYNLTAKQGDAAASAYISVDPARTAAGDLLLTTTTPAAAIEVHGAVMGKDASGQAHPLAGAFVHFIQQPFCYPAPPGASGGGSVGSPTTTGKQVAVPTVPPCIYPGPPLPIATSVSTTGSSGTAIAAIAPAGATTNDQGVYTLVVPSDTRQLVAEASGFLPMTQEVSLNTSGGNQVDFQLVPDPAAGLQATLSVDGQDQAPAANLPGGTPFGVTLSLKNTSSQPVKVVLLGTGDNLLLLNPDGSIAWGLNFGKLQPNIASEQTLQPGDSLTRHETVPATTNDGLALSTGNYTLQGQIAEARTNPVQILINGGSGNSIPPSSSIGVPVPASATRHTAK